MWALQTTQDTGQEKGDAGGTGKRHPVRPSGEGQEMDTMSRVRRASRT